MRLGIVMMGTGAHAAASVGVLKELARRGVEPYAVCGMLWGAWPAALYAAGLSETGMEKALHQASAVGRRMIAPSVYERMFLLKDGMPCGRRLNQLLNVQTGERVLSLCPGTAVFPCRLVRNGQRIVFSTRAYMQETNAMLAMQASAGFSARAVMAVAPFLQPLQFMGSALLAETDVAFACRQLLLLGAHRVLVISPQLSPAAAPDALDLAGAALRLAGEQAPCEEAAVLRVVMPAHIGALSLDRLAACSEAGEQAARWELDRIFERLGVAYCRVLPFKRQASPR